MVPFNFYGVQSMREYELRVGRIDCPEYYSVVHNTNTRTISSLIRQTLSNHLICWSCQLQSGPLYNHVSRLLLLRRNRKDDSRARTVGWIFEQIYLVFGAAKQCEAKARCSPSVAGCVHLGTKFFWSDK